MPSMSRYTVDGKGRDNYISFDNGGLQAAFSAELQATHGAFMEKKKAELHEKSLCHIGSKHISYFANGTGRDSYIS
jgi:hypothetical protein